MTPAEKVAHGLALARIGFAELRDERATLARWLADNRAAIAGGESEALALRFEATRGRAERSLSGTVPHRGDGFRLRDGQTIPARVDEETARSLALYVPTGGARTMPARRGLLARMLGSG